MVSALLAAADGGSHSLGDGDNVTTGGDAGGAGRGRAGGSRATGDDS